MTMTRRSFMAAAAAAAGVRTMNAAVPTNFVPGAVNHFGADLYSQVRTKSGNVFLSPFSVSTCLAMAAAGAKGATRDQMVRTLRLPADATGTDAGFQSLLAAINGAGTRNYQLSTANAVWAQQGYPWRPEFTARVAGTYGAGLLQADFRADPDGERQRINKWVEKETRDKIKDLLASGTVTPATRMVLANAVYFKGDWSIPFEQKSTKDAPFTTASGQKTPVPMMHRVGTVRLFEDETVQVAELPYQGDEVTMTIALPRRADGLPAVERRFAEAGSVAKFGPTRSNYDVRLYLPKFKIETEYELTPVLKSLGMTDAFGDADFSGMHSGNEHLNISAVAHKAFVEVNEKGTEAAAATGIVMRATAAPAGEPPTFRADHPFLFLIRHVPTDTVLFLGRYEKP